MQHDHVRELLRVKLELLRQGYTELAKLGLPVVAYNNPFDTKGQTFTQLGPSSIPGHPRHDKAMNIGDDLRRVVQGTVLAAADDGSEQARRLWNLAEDRHVLAVLRSNLPVIS